MKRARIRSTTETTVQFFNHVVPALGVGDYTLEVSQRVDPTTSPPIDESFSISQPFSVRGPRYALPAADVVAGFPADNAIGLFHQALPQVTLARRDLPWERNIFGDPDPTRQTPWLALLVFVDGEHIGGSANPSLMDPDVPGWVRNPVKSATAAATAFQGHGTAPVDGIRWPHLAAEWYETPESLAATPVAFIDVDPTAFAALMPTRAALRYLVHARKVDVQHKEDAIIARAPEGWYAVAVGGRLPDPPAAHAPGRRNIVHLVSLEGFEDVVGEDGVTLPAGTQRVRMISLARWSYTCAAEGGESFAQAISRLLVDGNGDLKSTTFALPVQDFVQASEADVYAIQSVRQGFTPLTYQTRPGEQTFAFYRGPFSPVPVANFVSKLQQDPRDQNSWESFTTASSALIYDKVHGLFNVSYAVAWETGRLLALSDGQLTARLTSWRRSGHALVDRILERKSQIPALQRFDPDQPDPRTEDELLAAIRPYAFTPAFLTYLVDELSAQLVAAADPFLPPEQPLPPFPAYPDMPSPPPTPTTIADLMKVTAVQSAIRRFGGEGLADIALSLAELYLLERVPFENLVPVADLLPDESLRFFYIDSNWVDSLIEGALSVATDSSRDIFYQDLLKDLVWKTTHDAVQVLRDRRLGIASDGDTAATPLELEALTGMLVRSTVVTNFPGLELKAFAGYQVVSGTVVPDPTTLMRPLRMVRLSSDVLLCLWPAVPRVVSLEEPQEGVQFGFEDPPPALGDGYYLYLRSLAADYFGVPMCSDAEIEAGHCGYQIDAVATGVIAPDTRTIDMSRLVRLIEQKLGVTELPVRDLAVELVRVPEQALFVATDIRPKEGA